MNVFDAIERIYDAAGRISRLGPLSCVEFGKRVKLARDGAHRTDSRPLRRGEWCGQTEHPAGVGMEIAPAHPDGGNVQIKVVNAPDAPRAAGGYAQACEVVDASRLLFVSGQVPLTVGDELPSTFDEQCRLAWSNVEAQLRAAGMSLANLVKVTIFLSDRRFAAENRMVRQEVLGSLSPALTVIITGIFDEAWLVEIEAIAAA